MCSYKNLPCASSRASTHYCYFTVLYHWIPLSTGLTDILHGSSDTEVANAPADAVAVAVSILLMFMM